MSGRKAFHANSTLTPIIDPNYSMGGIIAKKNNFTLTLIIC
jgi:hypothetical protein